MSNFNLAEINSTSDLLNFIRQDANTDGTLSIRGVARLAGVEHTSIIRDGATASVKLNEKLTSYGFESGALATNGFPPQAVILVLEYFAFESKAKALQAKQIMRTFGTIGLMATLGQLKSSQPQIQPKRDTIAYIEAAKTLESLKVNEHLKRLLEDSLTDELELSRNLSATNDKKAYTIAKVRAKELGYTDDQIGSGSGLGRYVRKHLEPAFQDRIGKFTVYHYSVDSRLDEVINSYFR